MSTDIPPFRNPGYHKITLQWELEYIPPGKTGPLVTSATVPGAVQLDISRAEGYGPYTYGENWKDYLWMEDCGFVYRASFIKPVLEDDQRMCFVSRGIEYAFTIQFNGEKVLSQEGMFTPVELDLTDRLKNENAIEITIHPAPKAHPEPADRTQAAQSVKPAVGYGWDWHPRLIPLGIWDDTYLEIVPAKRITDGHISYRLSPSMDRAEITADVRGVLIAGERIRLIIRDRQNVSVCEITEIAQDDQVYLRTTLSDPELWWPHDQGTPALYEAELYLGNNPGPAYHQKLGFRRVHLLMNEGAWDEPAEFPKSRSVAPAQLEINGRKIFARGSNWVHPEIFTGTITPERYDELTDRALEANFNMLRVWGGGIINKESFYRQCDEKGILVWQEFPLACNNYMESEHYLEILEQEAKSIIARIRKHPSLAIWSGGNELFNSWSGMTDQSLALRLLNSLCLEFDPNTPFIATAPLEGMGHGPYVFRDPDTGEEVCSLMQRARNTAYTEFGIPSPSATSIIRNIISEEELWPPGPGGSWESHHAFNAWIGDTWLMQDLIEDYFGPSANLDSLVEHGQILQSEGLKTIFEAARRQKPYCSMALSWCFNEPWPSAANSSMINYPNLPKPAFYSVSQACRPILASAAIQRFRWNEGDMFEADLWILNDSPTPPEDGILEAKIMAGNETIELTEWKFRGIKPLFNLEGPTVRFQLPGWSIDRFTLQLNVADHPEMSSAYVLLYDRKNAAVESTRQLNQ